MLRHVSVCTFKSLDYCFAVSMWASPACTMTMTCTQTQTSFLSKWRNKCFSTKMYFRNDWHKNSYIKRKILKLNLMEFYWGRTCRSPFAKISLQISVSVADPNALVRSSFLATWPLDTFRKTVWDCNTSSWNWNNFYLKCSCRYIRGCSVKWFMISGSVNLVDFILEFGL